MVSKKKFQHILSFIAKKGSNDSQVSWPPRSLYRQVFSALLCVITIFQTMFSRPTGLPVVALQTLF